MAFADNIVLIGENKEAAQKQIDKLDKFLDSLGMKLSIDKYSTFEIKTAHKTWYMRNPQLMVRGEEVPGCKPDEIITYLGGRLAPWSGFLRGLNITSVTTAIVNIGRMKLKPHQKLNLIRVYLLPRYIHVLVSCPPPIGLFERLDKDVRQEIKRILHLHLSTTDGILYTNKNHGGLGLPRMENIIKLAVIRGGLKMLESEDPLVRSSISDIEERLRRYSSSVGLIWPPSLEEVEETRRKLQRHERWEQLISQGQGVADFRKDKVGNAWIYNPKLLKPSRFINVLHLRTNTFGTRIVLRRADERVNPLCRRCNAMRETLGHILGLCTHTKPQRIRRHDEIKEFIADRLSQKHSVFVEPTVRVE